MARRSDLHQMLRIAFVKPGRFIDSHDHEVHQAPAGGVLSHVAVSTPSFSVTPSSNSAASNGNLLRPVCAVFKDLTTGQEWRLRRGEFGAAPPFSTGPDTSVRRLLRQRGDQAFSALSIGQRRRASSICSPSSAISRTDYPSKATS